uniref:flocculation protein FLO11-like n=1 Tax=Scatophagus argus TaxID=75038 RepID=UPI001ED84941|nr:flocculation protein FLO11-like [Scatophagus argus]
MELHHYLWLLFIVISCSDSKRGFNDNPDLDPQFYNKNWMKSIDDETLVSAVSIPGTHESLSLYGGPLAIGQVWKLDTQLKAGLRYFDVHAGIWLPTQKDIYIRDSHWMFWQRIQFDEVLKIIFNFLEENSSETVLLKVILHGFYKTKVTELMKKMILKLKNKIWTKLSVPKMQEARGKIVLLQSTFHDGTQNKESFFFENNKLKNVENKIQRIKSHLCDNQIVLTETTTSFLQSPKRLAKAVNKELYNFVVAHKKSSPNEGCIGVLSMNFPSADLIKNIIELKPCDCGKSARKGQGHDGEKPQITTEPQTIESTPAPESPTSGQDSEPTPEPTSATESPISGQDSEPSSEPPPASVSAESGKDSEPTPEPTSGPESTTSRKDSEPFSEATSGQDSEPTPASESPTSQEESEPPFEPPPTPESPTSGKDSEPTAEPTSSPETPESRQHSEPTPAAESSTSVQDSEPTPAPTSSQESSESGQNSEPTPGPTFTPESPTSGKDSEPSQPPTASESPTSVQDSEPTPVEVGAETAGAPDCCPVFKADPPQNEKPH